MSGSSSKVKLKLLVDKKNEKVLFAEAGKDFVDFLFSLMSLPLGKVVKLLTKNKMVGCIGNLYNSIESLSETYIQSSENVEFILNPKAPMVSSFQNPLLLSNDESAVRRDHVYVCSSYHHNVANDPNTVCPSCNRKMTFKLPFVEADGDDEEQVLAPASGGGFVEGVVTYMVMDNLEVKAIISSIALINTFNIKDLGSLEEKLVDVGVEEGLKILQLSLQSKDVLTSVFLCNYVARKQTQKRKRHFKWTPRKVISKKLR